MSLAAHRYVAAVLDDPTTELDTTARLLLAVLADFADADGVAWPGLDALARRVGIHVDNVARARARLVASGVIAVELSAGGRGRTNRYRFPVQAFVSLSPTPAVARGLGIQKPPRQRRETPAPASVNPRASAGGISNEPVMNRAPGCEDCGDDAAPGRWRCFACQTQFDHDLAAAKLDAMLSLGERLRNRPVV